MESFFLIKVNNNLNSLANMILKRIFDVVIAILILPFLLIVILILVIGIKLDQKARLCRTGPAGKMIRFLNSSTSKHAYHSDEILENYLKDYPEAAKEWKKYKNSKDFDPRVTKFAAFLRKTSFDEFSQIFNVLKGEMSLVGPRPYLPRERSEMKKLRSEHSAF